MKTARKPIVRRAITLSLVLALAGTVSACNEDEATLASALGNQDVDWPFVDLAGMDDTYYADAFPPMPAAAQPMVTRVAQNEGYGYAPAWYGTPSPSYDGPMETYYADDYGYQQGVSDYYDPSGYPDEYYDDGAGLDSYGLIAVAAVLGAILGDSPPDYGFDYGGAQPWVWETGDRYRRYAEPVYGGYRYYYYEPYAARPFLVRDPYYSYGYRDDELVTIWARDGRVLDTRRAWRQRQVADRYYDRGYELYTVSRQQDHYGVAAPLWTSRAPVIVREQREWERARLAQDDWRAWDTRVARKMKPRWQRERAVRQYASNRFEQWERRDFDGDAPRFYHEARRKPAFQQAVFRDRVEDRRLAVSAQPRKARQERRRLRENRREQRVAYANRDGLRAFTATGVGDRVELQRRDARPSRYTINRDSLRQERRQDRIERRALSAAQLRQERRGAERRQLRRADLRQNARQERAVQLRQERRAARRQASRQERAVQLRQQRRAERRVERRQASRQERAVQLRQQRRAERQAERRQASRQERAGQLRQQRRAERQAERRRASRQQQQSERLAQRQQAARQQQAQQVRQQRQVERRAERRQAARQQQAQQARQQRQAERRAERRQAARQQQAQQARQQRQAERRAERQQVARQQQAQQARQQRQAERRAERQQAARQQQAQQARQQRQVERRAERQQAARQQQAQEARQQRQAQRQQASRQQASARQAQRQQQARQQRQEERIAQRQQNRGNQAQRKNNDRRSFAVNRRDR